MKQKPKKRYAKPSKAMKKFQESTTGIIGVGVGAAVGVGIMGMAGSAFQAFKK